MQKMLEEKEAGVNDTSCGWTALMYACFYRNLPMINFLLDKGADVNLKNLTGVTALMMAVEKKQTDVIGMLLEHGAKLNDKDAQGMTGTS
jgi:ankyrin repeat protein